MIANTIARATTIGALCVSMHACSSSVAGPTPPSPESVTSFGGQWTGTTAQNAPIEFTVSSDHKVTAITVGHEFDGCSGARAFADLAIEIASLGGGRAFRFEFASAPAGTPNRILLGGVFDSNSTARGSVLFVDYPGCGLGAGTAWTATKR